MYNVNEIGYFEIGHKQGGFLCYMKKRLNLVFILNITK